MIGLAKVFSKERYIEVCGYDDYLEFRNWVDECDGKEVIDNRCLDLYYVRDEWCVEKGDQIMEFTKADLRTGMVVEYNNGEKALVLVGDFDTYLHGKQSIMFVEDFGFMDGSGYDEQLIYRHDSNNWTVKKVYQPKTRAVSNMFDDCNEQTLIWERGVDWSKVPVDTKVLVRESKHCEWERRYFANYEDGYIHTFPCGQTSWTTEGFSTDWWRYAKLAEEED